MSRQEPNGKLFRLHWTHILSDADWLRTLSPHGETAPSLKEFLHSRQAAGLSEYEIGMQAGTRTSRLTADFQEGFMKKIFVVISL